jgi:CheY-like chemotaxis protein
MEKKTTLLLVDDDEDDREFFSMVALENNCNVITLNDGVHLLEQVMNDESELPDLVFLDINMPLMNGLECLQHLRQIEKCKLLPIIMYTTSGNENDIMEATAYGANAFVRKPNSLKDLQKYIITLTSIDWTKRQPFTGELLFFGF